MACAETTVSFMKKLVGSLLVLAFALSAGIVGMIGGVTGGLVFGVVAVAWVVKQAMQLSESSQWGRSRQR